MLRPVAHAGHVVVGGSPPPSPAYWVLRPALPVQCPLQLEGDMAKKVLGRGAGGPPTGLCFGLQNVRLEDICSQRSEYGELSGL